MFGSANANRNHDKKLESLRGMLIGIQADKEFSVDEALYLDSWLRDAKELHHYGDVIDLIEQIADILDDGVITPEEMQDTFEMISDIEAYGEFKSWRNSEDSGATEFLGFLQGISVDDHISDKERQSLSKLLINLPETIICNSLINKLNDAILESDDSLLKAIRRCCGQSFKETGSSEASSLIAVCDDIDSINLDGKRVCFSGAVPNISRNTLKHDAEEKGYIVLNGVTQDTNYLVIGPSSSKDWISTSYGRKIEKALSYKEKGHKINVLTYDTWLELCSEKSVIVHENKPENISFDCKTFDELHQVIDSLFSNLEYVINRDIFNDDSGEGEFISIHRVRKNGTPLKKSELALYWANNEERTRPWTLYRDKGRTASYKSMQSALEVLQKEIQILLAD